MGPVRNLPVLLGAALLASALVVLIGDGVFTWYYGQGYSDTAYIAENGLAVEWPTGERPAWATIPTCMYSLGLLLASAVVFSLAPPKKTRFVTEWRGTE